MRVSPLVLSRIFGGPHLFGIVCFVLATLASLPIRFWARRGAAYIEYIHMDSFSQLCFRILILLLSSAVSQMNALFTLCFLVSSNEERPPEKCCVRGKRNVNRNRNRTQDFILFQYTIISFLIANDPNLCSLFRRAINLQPINITYRSDISPFYLN